MDGVIAMRVVETARPVLILILIFLLLPAQMGNARRVSMESSVTNSSPGDIGWQGGVHPQWHG